MTSHSTNITVTNGFDNPATITLAHRFGSNPDEIQTWEQVPFGKVGDPALIVHYGTGFLSPHDLWHVKVVVDDGPHRGTWQNSGWKECYLEEQDQQVTLQFSVSPGGGLKLNMLSSGCSTGLSTTE